MTIKAKEPITARADSKRDDSWTEKLQESRPICLILFAAATLVFWQVHSFEFVNYDDSDYVSANRHVQSGLTWQNVIWAFKSGHASNWHPLTWLSHMLDWQLFGQNPGPQHLVSAGIHAINVVLLFLVLKRMTGAHWLSAVVAGLFGLHPLRAESVAWISERKDVLSGLFLLLTLGAYCRYVEIRREIESDGRGFGQPGTDDRAEQEVGTGSGRRGQARNPPPHVGSYVGKAQAPLKARKAARPEFGTEARLDPPSLWFWYGATLLCFALGLMSKPMLVTAPFCLLLLDYWPLGRFRLEWQDRQKALGLLMEKTPFFALAIVSSVVTFLVQRSGGAVSTSLTLGSRLANAVVSYVRYLGKTVWPANLSVLYPHPGQWSAWQVAGSGLVLLLILFAVVFWARRRPYLAVGWFWFMGTLVPVIGLIQVGVQSMADRYTYVPSIGLLVLIVWGLSELARYRPGTERALGSLAVAAVVGCAFTTARQTRIWHDSESLFQHAIEVTSKNYLAYNNLGFDLSAKGKLEQAKENYRKSLQINPQYPDALNNMGFALAGEKRFGEAVPYYEAALRVSPKQPEIHNNLGNALSELGRLNEAIEQYSLVLREQPEHADAHNNLGIALAMEGKLPEAEEHFRAAIRFKHNDASAHSNLGNALAAAHRIPEAIREYQESLRLNPNDAQAHNNLGNVLVEQGRLPEAIQEYKQALQLNANNPEAHFNLAVALLRQDQPAEAATHFEAALRLNPGNLEANRQLQLLRQKLKSGSRQNGN